MATSPFSAAAHAVSRLYLTLFSIKSVVLLPPPLLSFLFLRTAKQEKMIASKTYARTRQSSCRSGSETFLREVLIQPHLRGYIRLGSVGKRRLDGRRRTQQQQSDNRDSVWLSEFYSPGSQPERARLISRPVPVNVWPRFGPSALLNTTFDWPENIRTSHMTFENLRQSGGERAWKSVCVL